MQSRKSSFLMLFVETCWNHLPFLWVASGKLLQRSWRHFGSATGEFPSKWNLPRQGGEDGNVDGTGEIVYGVISCISADFWCSEGCAVRSFLGPFVHFLGEFTAKTPKGQTLKELVVNATFYAMANGCQWSRVRGLSAHRTVEERVKRPKS